jgi:hypothetical protein
MSGIIKTFVEFVRDGNYLRQSRHVFVSSGFVNLVVCLEAVFTGVVTLIAHERVLTGLFATCLGNLDSSLLATRSGNGEKHRGRRPGFQP